MFTYPTTYFSSEIDLSLPITDSRLTAWYQPLDSGTLSLTGSLIDSIQDKSGDANGGGTITATGTLRPTLSAPDSMLFNGSNRLSNLSAFPSSRYAINSYTTFVVIRKTVSSGLAVLSRVANPATGIPGAEVEINGSERQRLVHRANYSSTGGDDDVGSVIPLNQTIILTYERGSVQNELWQNLTQLTFGKSNSTLTLATHQLAIGNHGANTTQGFVGVMKEIVMYAAPLTNQEKIDTINKLNQRYNAF